jgi:hypothetical protein
MSSKYLGATSWSKFHTEKPQIFVASLYNFVALAAQWPGFVDPGLEGKKETSN